MVARIEVAVLLAGSLLMLSLASATGSASCCTVTAFGAKGDNKTEDTQAVQNALSNVSCDCVAFPSGGRYLIRPVQLRSDLTVVVEDNATVVAWPDRHTWPNATSLVDADVVSRRVALRSGGILPLFYTDSHSLVRNLTIMGPGWLDGQGWRWWPFGKSIPRPRLLVLPDVVDLTVLDLRFRDSPSWNTDIRGENITIEGVHIVAGEDFCLGYQGAPNTDGINIGGRHIRVRNCFVHNGDDCIPTNIYSTARLGPQDTSDVVVENVHCECGTNGGVPIVEQGNNTVRDVLYRNMTVNSTKSGIGMKISEAYETVLGSAENITWEDIRIISPRVAGIYINVFQEDPDSCNPPKTPPPPHWLTASNFTYRNVRGTGVPRAGCFNCGPGRPCTDIVFENVTLTGDNMQPYICHNAKGTYTDTSPKPCVASGSLA